MSLKINVRESGNVVILDLIYQITTGEEAGVPPATRSRNTSTAAKRISSSTSPRYGYIDSTGLGQPVGSFATVTSMGGQLKLLNLQKKLQELMQITKLITVFETFDQRIRPLSAALPPQPTPANGAVAQPLWLSRRHFCRRLLERQFLCVFVPAPCVLQFGC